MTDKLNIKLGPGAYIPERAHEYDAGLDIRAREDKLVPAGGAAVFDTGVHIELPPYTAGFLKSKSGLNVKHNITSEGVIDTGYTGSICVKLYITMERMIESVAAYGKEIDQRNVG